MFSIAWKLRTSYARNFNIDSDEGHLFAVEFLQKKESEMDAILERHGF